MKKKIAITIIGLTVVLSIVACGNKDSLAEPTETNSIVEDSESIDTEIVTTESIETTEVAESETEISDEVAEIIAQLEEKGYNNIDPDLIDHMLMGDIDPLNTMYFESFEAGTYVHALPKIHIEGIGSQETAWAMSQGADWLCGWTIIFENGKGAGENPTYGIYVRPGDERYGQRFELGETLPNGTKYFGTRDENFEIVVEEARERFLEDGYEIEVDPETGKEIWIIP